MALASVRKCGVVVPVSEAMWPGRACRVDVYVFFFRSAFFSLLPNTDDETTRQVIGGTVMSSWIDFSY